MPARVGRKEGAEDSTQRDDEGDAGPLRAYEDADEDAEGEGAGLLPMDSDKTLAMVLLKFPRVLVSAALSAVDTANAESPQLLRRVPHAAYRSTTSSRSGAIALSPPRAVMATCSRSMCAAAAARIRLGA
jgi:hypothetical protein